jgi:DNA-binding PadR family transcriptional regulator
MNRTESFLPLKPDTFEMLLSLSGHERHGYAILKHLEARGIGLAASLLYRKLRRLMEDELVEESKDRPDPEADDTRRRYYRLTSLGEAVVRAEAARIVGLAASGRVRALAREARGKHA